MASPTDAVASRAGWIHLRVINPSAIVTLLTDFGQRDPYLGVMKGALLQRSVDLTIVDLCHGVTPQAIAEACYWIEKCHCWFPKGTVHVAVVDPTVGTSRAIVALYAAGHYFLAPDNGLLPDQLLNAPDAQVHQVDWPGLGLKPRGNTFHGRDIFAPVAALLASNQKQLHQLGPQFQAKPARLQPPTLLPTGIIQGQVVTVDHFGNLLTNIPKPDEPGNSGAVVSIGSHHLAVGTTYTEASSGQLLALGNAWGNVEIAIRDGSAAQHLKLGPGTPVQLRHALPPLSQLLQSQSTQ